MAVNVMAQCDCCEKYHPLAAKSIRAGLNDIKKVWVQAPVTMEDDRQDYLFCERCAACLGLFKPCPGEAHIAIRNGGDVDYCGVCTPRWNAVVIDPLPEIKWDEVVALYKKINMLADRIITETHGDAAYAAADDDQAGNIYPLEEDYFTTTQLT